MSNTEQRRLQRAAEKLEIPTEQLDAQVVNLQFSNDKTKTVYKMLKVFLTLHNKLTAKNLTFKDVSNWVDNQN